MSPVKRRSIADGIAHAYARMPEWRWLRPIPQRRHMKQREQRQIAFSPLPS